MEVILLDAALRGVKLAMLAEAEAGSSVALRDDDD